VSRTAGGSALLESNDEVCDQKTGAGAVVINAGHTSFFATMYDPANFQCVLALMNPAAPSNGTTLSAVERAGVVLDTSTIAYRGTFAGSFATMTAGNVMATMARLALETSLDVWTVSAATLARFARILERQEDEDVPADLKLFRDWAAHAVDGISTVLGWGDSGTHAERLLRPVVQRFAVQVARHGGAINTALAQFDVFVHDDPAKVATAVRRTVLRAGVVHTAGAFGLLFDLLVGNGTLPSTPKKDGPVRAPFTQPLTLVEREDLIYALAGAGTIDELTGLMSLAVANDTAAANVSRPVLTQDIDFVFGAVAAATPAGTNAALSFVLDNKDALIKLLGPQPTVLLPSLADVCATTHSYDLFNFVVNDVIEYNRETGTDLIVARALEEAQAGVAWANIGRGHMMGWLRLNKPTRPLMRMSGTGTTPDTAATGTTTAWNSAVAVAVRSSHIVAPRKAVVVIDAGDSNEDKQRGTAAAAASATASALSATKAGSGRRSRHTVPGHGARSA
jgi:hypothetical protein